MEKEDKILYDLPEIPKNSRLAKYLDELPNAIEEKRLIPFMKNAFQECFRFICLNEYVPMFPHTIAVKFIPTTNQFFKELEEQLKNSIQKEEPKKPELTSAFVKSNTIHIDLERQIQILREYGGLSFVMDLVDIYVHEICHLAYPRKSEQEIFEMQCSFLEDFLGIKLPEKRKKFKISDYYESKKQEKQPL